MKKTCIFLLLATVAGGAFAHDREYEYTLKVRNGSDDKVDITCDNGASYDSVAAGATQSIGFSSGNELNLNCTAIGPNGEQMDQKRVHAHQKKPFVNWNVRHQHTVNRYVQPNQAPAQYDSDQYRPTQRQPEQYAPIQRRDDPYAPTQRVPNQQNYQR